MATKELNGNGKIVVARTEIYAPHLGEVLAFSLPMEGPDYFKNVMSAIDQDKGLRPTTGQTFSLVDLALKNPDEEHCKDILSKFRNRYFWTATENLWGEKDVIVYDNVDGKMPTNRKDLIKMHKDGNPAVRVVSYGFQTGSQLVSDFVKNPYVLAQVDGDKAFAEDVVARVAEKISKHKPYVGALNPTTEDVKRYTALYSYWDDDRLDLVGDGDDYYGNGCASRVRSASAESAKPQKK